MSYGSWGRLRTPTASAMPVHWIDSIPRLPDVQSLLPYGNGRSYGDSCLNEDGWLLDARGLNRFRSFDPVTGILNCEAGVLLTDILALIVPKGWFLPVTPGTQYVTVGGAIANDVHGKNHHRTGTFGHHVRRLALWRSDNSVTVCSLAEHPDLFRATIGGLGLTGLMVWAELQLRPIESTALRVDTQRFGSLQEFFVLSQESDADFEYTVAWIDCLARGRALGRGVFWRANHAPAGSPAPRPRSRSLNMPWTPPIPLVNRVSLQLFNSLLYRKTSPRLKTDYRHYAPFFYPLDRIKHWNRMYGPRGFFQYQCVVPPKHSIEAIT
ncbi:MAG: FAD-binding oxidoreductase, partial [Burkholderiales bacterium]